MKINLRDRFVLLLSLTGIVIITLLGVLSYGIARESITERTFAQLKTIRNARKFQLEQYFRDREAEVQLLGQSQEINRIFGDLKKRSGGMSPGDTVHVADPASYIFSNVFGRSSNHRLILSGSDTSGFILEPAKGGIITASFYNASETPLFNDLAAESIKHNSTLIHDYIAEDSLPMMYVFAPMKAGQSAPGAIGLGISADALNSILLEQNDENGLGYSGEVYVIGKDNLMRSQSRFLKESVMFTQVVTQPALSVFETNDGNMIAEDYRGISVLSSYSTLRIPGLNWAILAEIDEREALKPLETLRNTLLLISVGIVFILVFISFWLARFFTRPLLRLKTAVSQIGTGHLGIQVDYQSDDELGDLAGAFNEMSSKLKDQRTEIDAREQQLEAERKKRILFFIDGQEKERQRLSRELHDGIGQIFVATRFQLESLSENKDIQQHPSLQQSQKLVNLGITEIRKISNGLAPAVLSELGLASALRSLCTQMEDSSGIKIHQTIADASLTLTDMEATHLYRIVQEALSNAVKHSRASEIEVNFTAGKQMITLLIQDNGCGFNSEEAAQGHGLGLANIRERARLIGASLSIGSKQQCGTKIELTYELKDSHGE